MHFQKSWQLPLRLSWRHLPQIVLGPMVLGDAASWEKESGDKSSHSIEALAKYHSARLNIFHIGGYTG